MVYLGFRMLVLNGFDVKFVSKPFKFHRVWEEKTERKAKWNKFENPKKWKNLRVKLKTDKKTSIKLFCISTVMLMD